jgi:hypothetical protein
MNFYIFFLLLLWVIFALLDPDPLTRLNPDPIRMRNPSLEDGRPGDAVVGPGELYRVVGVEGAALVGQLGLELGGEGEQGVVLDRRQPMLGEQERKRI